MLDQEHPRQRPVLNPQYDQPQLVLSSDRQAVGHREGWANSSFETNLRAPAAASLTIRREARNFFQRQRPVVHLEVADRPCAPGRPPL